MRKVAVTGIGHISSLGSNASSVLENALNRNTGLIKQQYKIDGELLDESFIHKAKKITITDYFKDSGQLREIFDWKGGNLSGDLELFLATIKLALDDSGLKFERNYNSIGLILSAESSGHNELFKLFLDHFYTEIQARKIIDNKSLFYKEAFNRFKKPCYDLQAFMDIFYVAKVFGFHGYTSFINNACASGLYALELGAQLIREGRCSCVVVSAVDCIDVFKNMWLKNYNLISSDGRTRPFCRNANGFTLGEGGSAFLLEDLDVARSRGSKLYAEYLGGAFNVESWKVMLPAITESYYTKVLEDALISSKVTLKDIDLMVLHGLGSRITDQYECNSLLGLDSSGAFPPITAFKPYLGHNLGGCTLLETSLLLFCLNKSVVLPILNSEEILSNKKLKFITKMESRNLNIVLKACTAFGGFNAAAIFKKVS